MSVAVAVAGLVADVEAGLSDGCLTDVQLEFLAAMETWAQDEATRQAVMHGQGDIDEIGRKAALGGADLLSRAVFGLAARMWDREGRRGFRGSITRFRFAARIVMRWMASGWLSFALALEPEPEKAAPPVAPAPEVVTWRKIRDQICDRMRTGPPAVMAVSEVPVIDP